VALAPDPLILIAAKTARPDQVDTWLDALRPIVAAVGGTLWELHGSPASGGPGPGHTHVILLDSLAAAAAYDRAIAVARESAALPIAHAEIRRDTWTRHGTAPRTPGVNPDGLIAAEVLCTDPDRHQEWDHWYDREHLPDMLASGAFVAGTRWRRATPRDGGANDLTLYEISGVSVDEAITRSAAVLPGLVASGRKHECHTGGLTMALERVS